MTHQDKDTLENCAELLALRAELTQLERARDELAKDRHSSDMARLQYDIALTKWSRAFNRYEDALRAVVLP